MVSLYMHIHWNAMYKQAHSMEIFIFMLPTVIIEKYFNLGQFVLFSTYTDNIVGQVFAGEQKICK